MQSVSRHDAIVCEAWEGGHNVLCAQLLKDSHRGGMHRPLFALIRELGASGPRIDAVEARWNQLLELPDAQASAHIRDIVDELRPVVQAAALRAEATTGVDPLLTVVADHLLAITERGWDPLADTGLQGRVDQLTRRAGPS